MKKLCIAAAICLMACTFLFAEKTGMEQCFNVCKKRVYIECIKINGEQRRVYCMEKYRACENQCRKGTLHFREQERESKTMFALGDR